MCTDHFSHQQDEHIRKTLQRFVVKAINGGGANLVGFYWLGRIDNDEAQLDKGVTWPIDKFDDLALAVQAILHDLGIGAEVHARQGREICRGCGVWRKIETSFTLTVTFFQRLTPEKWKEINVDV